MKKYSLNIPDTTQYVRLLSGMVKGGMTRKEMEIIILIMELMERENSTHITQDIKERIRLHLELSSQTMHNYWNDLKKKKIIRGKYKDFTLNPLFSSDVELTLTFNGKKAG